MREGQYLFLRRFFYWVISVAFIAATPIIVYYSLGYKFDNASKHFLKTGLISIKSFPRGVHIVMDNKRLQETAPCTFRELMPRTYVIILEKEGYYPYQKEVVVRPSLVSELDVMLVPKMKNIEKLNLNLNVYKFFITKHFLGDMIIIFTDQGIYFLDSDFKNPKKISSFDFGVETVATIRDIKEINNRLIFWSQDNIWMLELPELPDSQDAKAVVLYKAQEEIREVFVGLKERYLIIHDGLKVIALDIANPSVYFNLLDAKSTKLEMYYDARMETIYFKDKTQLTNSYSLFRMELLPLINERKVNEKAS